MERAYRNKINLQPPRCTKITCSRCNTRRKHPKWFKYKNWTYFFLLYLSLTLFNLFMQIAYFAKELDSRGELFLEKKTPNNDDYLVAIVLLAFVLLATVVIFVVIHWATAHVFQEYYLHNGPLETGDSTSTDEKKSANERAII